MRFRGLLQICHLQYLRGCLIRGKLGTGNFRFCLENVTRVMGFMYWVNRQRELLQIWAGKWEYPPPLCCAKMISNSFNATRMD